MSAEQIIKSRNLDGQICTFNKDDIKIINKTSLWKDFSIILKGKINEKEYREYLYSSFELLTKGEEVFVRYKSKNEEWRTSATGDNWFKYGEYILFTHNTGPSCNEITILYKIEDNKFLAFKEKLIDDLSKFILPPEPRPKRLPSVGLLTMVEGSFEIREGDILPENISINEFQQDIRPKLTNIIDKIKNKKKGIALLYGEPGTGKTTFIKLLINEVIKGTEEEKESEKSFIFIPPQYVGKLTSPELIEVILRWGRNSVLIIEDAERALQSREIENNEIISTLLNLTDGIMSDILGMQAIATFNCNVDKIDNALLRPGRLIELAEFKKFTAEEAAILSKGKITIPATLAEIFCGEYK